MPRSPSESRTKQNVKRSQFNILKKLDNMMGSIMKRVKVLESAVNVEENSDDDFDTSDRGEAKNSPSDTAKHTDPRFAGCERNTGQNNGTNCFTGVQHYTPAESDVDSDFGVSVPGTCAGTDEHDVLTMLEGELEPEGQERPVLTEKLSKITKSRFRVDVQSRK